MILFRTFKEVKKDTCSGKAFSFRFVSRSIIIEATLVLHMTCFSFIPLFQFCRSGSNHPVLFVKMATFDDDFLELVRQLQLPEEVKDAFVHNGYDCTLTFGLAFSSMQMLDQHIAKFLPIGETDTTSPITAHIRALWSRCNNMHTSLPIPPAQQVPPTPSPTPPASQLSDANNWHETLPPKLTTDDMEAMKLQLGKNYPGEVLDAHSTPSIRLWSLVHQQKMNKYIKYIPIQLRLSEHQYSAMIETRSSKPIRSEIQLLSQLCWEDTPEMDINSVRFSRDWLSRTQTVLRNAYSLCGMCHLQIFKAFDSKINEHTFPHLDSELGLRHVMAQEFFSADPTRRYGIPWHSCTPKALGPLTNALMK